jgi:hypothetical protein
VKIGDYLGMESKTIITLNSTKDIVNLVKNVMRLTRAYPVLAVKKFIL